MSDPGHHDIAGILDMLDNESLIELFECYENAGWHDHPTYEAVQHACIQRKIGRYEEEGE